MKTAGSSRFLLLIYAVTVFVSAFLLFQVQPLISRRILPWFGGSPAVWTTCMLFFQCVLFLGYAYAHAAHVADVIAAAHQSQATGKRMEVKSTFEPVAVG